MQKFFFVNFEQDNPLAVRYCNKGYLFEGLIKTYPINKAIEYVTRLFCLNSNQFQVIKRNGTYKILVCFENTENKKNQMNQAMNLCGYELAGEAIDKEYIQQMYTAKYSESLTKEIKNNMIFLIHITPSYNKEKILKYGFTPKSKNEFFTYSPSVFFFTQDAPLIHIVDQVYQKDIKIKNNSNNHIYSLFRVDVSKIPDSVKFETDPNLRYAVRTRDNISNKTIIGKPIDFNVIEKYQQLMQKFF